MKTDFQRLVLENSEGQVIRSFEWKDESAEVVYRQDTRRLEIHPNLEWLDQMDFPYTHIKSISRNDELSKTSLPALGQSRLQLVSKVENLQLNSYRDLQLSEGQRDWWRGLIISIVVLVGIVGISLSLPRQQPQSEIPLVEHVVKLMNKPSEKKITPKNSPRPVVVAPRQNWIGSIDQVKSGLKGKAGGTFDGARKGQHGGGIRRMGALGVLGTLSAGNQRQGGVHLGAIKTSPGSGRGGGSANSGGVQTTLYGKGILAAPLGGGGNIYGAGGTGADGEGSTGRGGGQDGGGQIALYGADGDGTSSYGTKGKGGGQKGYGDASMIGAAKGAPIPLGREAIIQGGLDSEMISAVIQKNMGQVRFCYEQGLQGDPKLAGRVAISFIIGTSGMVKVAGVASTSLNSKLVEDCILLRLKSWKFPMPEGGVEVKVSYPFLLRRTGHG